MSSRFWYVKARAFDRHSGKPLAPAPRVEKIDTVTNKLFAGCTTLMEVRTAYESFWNDLNPDSESVVFVEQLSTVPL